MEIELEQICGKQQVPASEEEQVKANERER
jgi:hypothetical protein